MAIRYTVTTHSCPHCNGVIKRDNEGLWMVLNIFLLPIHLFVTLPIIIARAIIAKVTGIEIVKIGSPYINCKRCGKPVLTNDKVEWQPLKDKFKRMWSFRWLFRTAYVLGGAVIFFIILPFLFGGWWSSHQVDKNISVGFLITAVICIVVIGIIIYLWIRYKKVQNITLTQSDYAFVEESNQRYAKSGDQAICEELPIKIWGTGRIIEIPKTQVPKRTINLVAPTQNIPSSNGGNASKTDNPISNTRKEPSTIDDSIIIAYKDRTAANQTVGKGQDNGLKPNDQVDMQTADKIQAYGRNPDDPICIHSIPDEYSYMNRLVCASIDDMIVMSTRIGSVGHKDVMFDKWKVEVRNKISGKIEEVILFLNPYSHKNDCNKAPQGFRLK